MTTLIQQSIIGSSSFRLLSNTFVLWIMVLYGSERTGPTLLSFRLFVVLSRLIGKESTACGLVDVLVL